MSTQRPTAGSRPALCLTVPRPDARLSPNARVHWSTRQRLVREEREAAGWLARVAITDLYADRLAADPLARTLLGAAFDAGLEQGWRYFPADVPVRVDVLVRLHRRRRCDETNLIASLKATEDGLTDGGVWSDDAQVRWGRIEWERGPVDEILLTLTAAE